MRPRLAITLVSVLFLALILIWLFLPGGESGRAVSSHDLGAEQQNDTVSLLLPEDAWPEPEMTGTSNQTGRAQLAPPLGGIEEWRQRIHRPIEFYGLVVDESIKPVEGATVSLTCNQFLPPEGTLLTYTVTDERGLFSLSGVMGGTLGVRVEKPGYYPVRSMNQVNFDYTERPGFSPFRPDPSRPVLFHLRKRGNGADLVTSRHGFSPSIEITHLRERSPLRLDFFTQEVGADGQIELGTVKPAPGQEANEWSFRMSIPDGGFVEHDDEFPFEAPESGYQPTVEYQFKKGDPNWTESLQKQFYIAFGQPRRYGHIKVETRIDRGVRLTYAINPTGLRNLEPKEPEPPQRELPPGVTEVIPDYVK